MKLENGMVLENTYKIIDEIGAGGGGVVFRARHLRLQTDVVVKKIKDEVLDTANSRQEADILKNLKHSCLPRVYDFIEEADGVYTVMDFIEGEDLDSAVKTHGKFPEKQVRKWAEQLGSALEYLHSQETPIIHSDIKPANVMLTKDGNVCLIDFNIALAMGGPMESAVGLSVGFSPPEQYRDPAMFERITNHYVMQESLPCSEELMNWRGTAEQPEQAGGGRGRTKFLNPSQSGRGRTKHLDSSAPVTEDHVVNAGSTLPTNMPQYTQYFGKGIDARSDIYSLGVTLYYMLTGIEPPPDFSQRIPVMDTKVSVTEGFSVILEKMMKLSPAERYQNGGEFLRAVENCYKFDRRYRAMRRKQTALQTASMVSMAVGILFITGGIYRLHMEKNSAYYELVSQAVETMAQSDYDTAGELLGEAKALDADRIEAYAEEVLLFYLSGDYAECIRRGENYINTTPFLAGGEVDDEQFANIYYLVGNAYFEQQDYLNAGRFFAAALEQYAGNALFFRDYAITLAKMGQTEKAAELLAAGTSLGLGKDSVYMAQGEIDCAKGAYEAAEGHLKQAIETTADAQMRRRAIMLCADVYERMGSLAIGKEIALLEQYKDQFEGSGKLAMTEKLAEAYAKMAQIDEVDGCYEKALSLFLSLCEDGYVTYQIQENIAILYENLRQFDEAETVLRSMAENYPGRYEVYKRLAYLEADRQQTKDNADRSYGKVQEYYNLAKERYDGREQDLEMEMLDVMMQEIQDGGWLQ